VKLTILTAERDNEWNVRCDELVVRTKRRSPFVWCLANHYIHDSSGLCAGPHGYHLSDLDH
jgi:hypothetical protein